MLVFLMWSLPGAIGMFALSLGVQRISETLPGPAYAFLSGLNASTVGIIAVAGVGLARKCIKDNLSRILVIFGACAGLCYSALWYYPVLVAVGGIAAVTWDLWLGRQVRRWQQKREAKKLREAEARDIENRESSQGTSPVSVELQNLASSSAPKHPEALVQRRQPQESPQKTTPVESHPESTGQAEQVRYGVSGRMSMIVLTGFLISFITVMVLRAKLPNPPLSLSLFANMYLAGTIIFGGGPVVIPLLREYVVTPGWVSPRDFLIGLAIIQAFPGPNFNFSVYLGALTLAGAAGSAGVKDSFAGAVLAFVGIFAPGLFFTIFIQGVWRKLRTNAPFIALLRGVNATAVGLVFTAVYRLWEVGYLTKESTSGSSGIYGGRPSGRSLADEPWWVVVAVVTFSGNEWFNVPAAISIAIGGILGLVWYGVTQA